MNELVLVKRAEFNGVELDCYVKPKQKDKGDFWATREQIGRLLEYEEPMKAIAKIHERHSERLDKFSTIVKLTTVEGSREVAREVTVYSFKGLLEICRYSNQPKADAVMDWLFEVADEIRRTGSYTLPRKAAKKKPALSLDVMSAAGEISRKALRCEKNIDVQEVLALDEVFKHFAGESVLQIAHFTLKCHENDDEQLFFEFTHPDLRMLKMQNEYVREMYNSANYLNLMEELRYEGTD